MNLLTISSILTIIFWNGSEALFKMKAIPNGFIPGSYVSVRGHVLNPEVDSFIVDIQETNVSLNKGVVAMHFRPHFKGNYTELRFLKDGVWNTDAENQMPLLIKPDASDEFSITIYSTMNSMKVSIDDGEPYQFPHNLENLEKVKVLGVYGDLNEEVVLQVGFQKLRDGEEESSPPGGAAGRGMDKPQEAPEASEDAEATEAPEVPEVPEVSEVPEVPAEVSNDESTSASPDEDTTTPPEPPGEPVEPSLDAAPVQAEPEASAPSIPLEAPKTEVNQRLMSEKYKTLNLTESEYNKIIKEKEEAAEGVLGPVENIDL